MTDFDPKLTDVHEISCDLDEDCTCGVLQGFGRLQTPAYIAAHLTKKQTEGVLQCLRETGYMHFSSRGTVHGQTWNWVRSEEFVEYRDKKCPTCSHQYDGMWYPTPLGNAVLEQLSILSKPSPAKVLKRLSKEARRMLPKFPGVWDAAGLLEAISELIGEGLIEQTKLPLTGTYTYTHTILGCECAAELDRQKKKAKR